MGTPLSVSDYERLAEEALTAEWLGFFTGGAGDEWTLAENAAAFTRRRLRPRVLRGIDGVDTRTTVLGAELGLPLLVAPVAFQRMAHADGEAGMARAAAAAGAGFCFSTFATATPAEVAEAAPDAVLMYQIYVLRDRGLTDELVAAALDAGFRALLLTVDLPVVGKRERERRSQWTFPADLAPAAAAAVARGASAGELRSTPRSTGPTSSGSAGRSTCPSRSRA